MKIRTGMLALLMLVADLALAAPDAVVEGMQMPAWVTRDGVRKPLAIGTALESEDRVSTGPGSRLLLRLGDGSLVKLGENGELQLSNLVQRRSENFIGATLRVLSGAFRFTTEAVARTRSKREIDVRFATVTAGIRGTDIWGKGSADRDIVCLIEGKIEVEHRGEKFAMNEPLSFLIAPREGPRLPVAPVPEAQLKEWALETEIAPASGATRRNGKHRIVAASNVDESAAKEAVARLRGAGYPAAVRAYRSGEALRYDVNISGLASAEDAAKMESALRTAGLLLR